MFRLKYTLLAISLLVCSKAGLIAQDRLVVVQAESGTLGSDFVTATAGGATYITAGTDFASTGAPGIAEKVASYSVTFPQAGTYNLYARVRVGPQGAADESYYYGNGFGVKAPADANAWILVNNNPNVGYTAPADVVLGAGTVGGGVFKWIRLSGFNFSENGPTFVVPAGALTQTFQLGTRENGLDIDMIAFGLTGNNFTVANLLNIPPVVTADQTLTAFQGSANGDPAGVVVATDADVSNTLQAWTITGGTGASVFAINASSGQLTVIDAAALNASVTPSYSLTVTVRDGIFTSAPENVTVNVDPLGSIGVVNQPAPGSYKAGDLLSFQIGLSSVMSVNTAGGTPRLALTIGANTRYATYVSGSGSNRLVFAYTVQAGDEDNDGIAVISPLDLNGGEIKDGANNDITLNFIPPGTSGVRIDTTGPAAPVELAYNNASRTINGTAEANSSLKLFLDGVLSGSTTVSALGDWSVAINVSQLAAGDHLFTVTTQATDAVGNVGTLSSGFPITIVIDPNAPLIVQAESGVLGSDYATLTAGGVSYINALTDLSLSPNSQSPGPAAKVSTYTITFPTGGLYNLYARVRVGGGGGSDDSFYYGNGFGSKDSTNPNDWITVNNINGVGFTAAADWVTHPGSVWSGGGAGSNTFKWVQLSLSNTDELGIQFTVPSDARTQTFQIGTRENGLDIDQFTFALNGLYFTVANLNNVVAGTTTPPPAPYVPTHEPLATGKPKFLGGAYSNPQAPNFAAYFNQVTPENAGKWGSVEGTRDVMNWTEMDAIRAFAKANGFPLRFHILVWGNQQPAWIESLPPAEQLEEIEEWYAAVATRYGEDIEWLEVVNEPLHDPPNFPGNGGGNYINALGGAGATGWDWVLNAFRLARLYFPGTKLMLNDYSVENDGNAMTRYIEIVRLLQEENLIDMVGVQGHAFSLTVPAATLTNNLNRLAETGLPIQITELDIDGLIEANQESEYRRVFPALWEHPAVMGITLWGYRPGHWRSAQGAAIVFANGAEELSMLWLKDYIRNSNPPLQPGIVEHPQDAVAFVGETASFTVAANGNPAPTFQWQRSNDGGETWTNVVNGGMFSGATTDTLVITGVGYALNGTLFRVEAANGHGRPAVSEPAILTIDILITAHVRHAPIVNGTINGSVQMLLGENVSLNSSARITGHLLVPGTPTVSANSRATYGGTLDGPGSESPSNYSVTINGGAVLGHVVRRIDPVTLPTVTTPSVPTGTQDVTVNKAIQPIVFETLRNLTLNAGSVTVPAGTYGTFIGNKNTSFTLGVADSTEAAVYNLQGLTLNSGAQVNIIGPVILNVRNTVVLNSSTVGTNSHPEWLLLSISDGGLTLNSTSRVNGFVVAPTGMVAIGGGATINGGVQSDTLTINSKGLMKAAE